MSASLVGSEMCIRDSHSGGRSGDASAGQAFPMLRAARSLPGDAPAATAPVSYTHLTLPTICSV
eukprot:10005690-Alexandrium_andersonii.AAC.1